LLQVRLDPAQADEAPSSMQAFVCGLAAGMLAKLGTHPLDVAKKRFQVGALLSLLFSFFVTKSFYTVLFYCRFSSCLCLSRPGKIKCYCRLAKMSPGHHDTPD